MGNLQTGSLLIFKLALIQGPPISNFCLNLVAHLVETNKEVGEGAPIQIESPWQSEDSLMEYPDDMALVDNNKVRLQEITDLLCKYADYALKKTK